MIRVLIFLWCWLALFSAATSGTSGPIELSAKCPLGFELLEGSTKLSKDIYEPRSTTGQGRCELRSLYQFYTSNQNRGVGGTQTSLPPYRDGFSPQQIDLGRYLFFDPLLSKHKTLACASCHHPDKAFTDGRARSIGSMGRHTDRSAPSLWNTAFQTRFFWDARAQSLEEQAQGPLYSPVEMANNPIELANSLRGSSTYRRLFKVAYPNENGFKLSQVYHALAAFQSSLISLNSRYDQYAHGNHAALTEREIKGLNVFRSFVARCAECHTPPLFTNNQIAVIGAPEPHGAAFDVGAQKTFENEKMRGGFKVPTLRNIALTAPYMHSGNFSALREAAKFYTGGRGHAVPEGEALHIHWHIWEPDLTDAELDQITYFLGALTDQRFLPTIPNRVPSGLTPVGVNGTLVNK